MFSCFCILIFSKVNIDDTYDLSKTEIRDSFLQSHINDTSSISMKKRAPEPTSFDLDYPHPEDLAPLSHVPIKPQKLEDPEFATADKENQGNILGNQHENLQQQQKKAEKEKSANDKQTKEILKMIVDMNDVSKVFFAETYFSL